MANADFRTTSVRNLDLPPKSRNALLEAGILDAGALGDASDGILGAIPLFTASRIRMVRGRLADAEARHAARPTPPVPDQVPDDAVLLSRPVLDDLLKAADALGPRNAVIARSRLCIDSFQTQAELAARFGVSAGRVTQLERNAMRRLAWLPLPSALRNRFKAAHEARASLSAIAAEPWADGIPVPTIRRLALYLASVRLT